MKELFTDGSLEQAQSTYCRRRQKEGAVIAAANAVVQPFTVIYANIQCNRKYFRGRDNIFVKVRIHIKRVDCAPTVKVGDTLIA